MTDQSPSCVSSHKFGVGSTRSAALPAAHLVEDVVGETTAVVEVSVAHEGGAGDANPQQAPQEVPNRSGCVIGLGWFFFFTALTQAAVAMEVRTQGIEVIDYFIGEVFYPRAGNPWIGFLNLATAVTFLATAGYRYRICCSVCFEILAVIVCVVSLGWSFGELGVYNALKDYDRCIDNVDGNYDLNWSGDCYCWDDKARGGAPAANVDASTSCNNVLDHVDNILVSYVLMAVLMGFSVVALVVRCTASREELSMPYQR